MGKVKDQVTKNNGDDFNPGALVPGVVSNIENYAAMTRTERMALVDSIMGNLSFDELDRQAEEHGTEGVALREFSKEELVGKPFVIIDANVRESQEFGGYFATLRIVTKDNEGGFFHASGEKSGIVNQLQGIGEISPQRMHRVTRGLRVSRYTFTNKETGKESPATTYYLDYEPKGALKNGRKDSRAQA